MEEAASKQEANLANGSVWKLIARMSIPAVILMLIIVVYSVADIFFIGQTGDAAKVAAVALASPIYAVLQAFGTLLGSGASTLMSISLGEKNDRKVKSISSFCCYATIFLGVLFALGVLVFADPLAKLLGADVGTLGYTSDYIKVLLMGAPFILFSSVFGNIVRSDGSVKESLVSNLIGSGLNIVLDPLFILGFGWGVAGAAVATVLGNAAASIYLLLVVRKKDVFSLKPKDFSLKKDIALSTLVLGIPMSLSTLLMSFGDVALNNMLKQYGDAAVAAFGVAGRITMVLAMVSMGICMGIQPLLAYCYGAKDYPRMKEVIWKVLLTCIVSTSFLTLLCFLFRDGILTAFINEADVIALGRRFLLAALISGPVSGVYQLCSSFLQSTANVKGATIVACLRKGIVYIPITFIFFYAFGMDGLVAVTPVADYISIVIAVVISHFWFKKMKSNMEGA